MIREKISVAGILKGFVTMAVSTFLGIAVLIPLFYNHLIRTGPVDILVKTTGPLLVIIFILMLSTALGVYICSKKAKQATSGNTVLVTAAFMFFLYWLDTSPSNENFPPPFWFVATSYSAIIIAAAIGHFSSKQLISVS